MRSQITHFLVMENSDGLSRAHGVDCRVELEFLGLAEEGRLSEVGISELGSGIRRAYLGTVRERLSGSILNYILNKLIFNHFLRSRC